MSYRAAVDLWMDRHPEWPTTITFTTSGPEHQQTFICTYTLAGIVPIAGDQMRNRRDAKESAAEKAFAICSLWEREVSTRTRSPSFH